MKAMLVKQYIYCKVLLYKSKFQPDCEPLLQVDPQNIARQYSICLFYIKK